MGKKILLARLDNEKVYALFKPVKTDRILPPLSLMYLEAYLTKEGHEVLLWDNCIDKRPYGDVLADFNPGIVGIGGTTPESDMSLDAFAETKRWNPDIVTVAGGPHFGSFAPIPRLIDYIVHGDGEYAIAAIAADKVPIVTTRLDMPIRTKEELDRLPCPLWEQILKRNDGRWPYTYVFGNTLVPTATIITTRGCPHRCIFCYNSKNPRIVQSRSLEKVVEEIKAITALGIRHFVMLDENFKVNDKLLSGLRECNIVYKCLMRADTVVSMPKRTCDNLIASGCHGISVGVESGNEQLLNGTKKGITLDTMRQAFDKLVHYPELEKRASFIIGHPYETEETIKETIAFSCSLKADKAFFNIMTPYPSSVIYDLAQKGEGIWLVDEDWGNFKRFGNCTIRTETLNPADLVSLQKEAQMRFYMQPRIVLDHIKALIDGDPDKEFCNRPLTEALEWLIECGEV